MSWQMEARWTEAYEEGWWSVHVGVCVCVCFKVCCPSRQLASSHASAELLPGGPGAGSRKQCYGVSRTCLSVWRDTLLHPAQRHGRSQSAPKSN